jgi:HK97 gp10 family phage protein
MAKRAVSIGLTGHLTIIRRMKEAGPRTRNMVEDVLLDSSLAIMNDARTRAPVRKLGKVIGGRLRASINVIFYDNGLTADVGTDVEYAVFVEFGTGRRGAATNMYKRPPGYVHGPKKGMAAQPYLFPAWDAEKDRFLRKLRAAFRKGLGE